MAEMVGLTYHRSSELDNWVTLVALTHQDELGVVGHVEHLHFWTKLFDCELIVLSL